MKYLMLILLVFSFTATLHCIEGMLITTIDYAYADKFQYTLRETTPNISSVSSVYKKQYFTLIVALAGFSTDNKNMCNIEFDIKVLKPNGQVFFEQNSVEGLKAEIPNMNNDLILTPATLRICFEEADAYGKYKFSVKIRDVNTKQDKELTRVVELRKSKFKKTKFNEASFSEYFENYYLEPKPDKAVDAFLFYADSKLSENENAVILMLALFVEIFDHNEYLIPYLYQKFPKQNAKTRALIICLLSNLKYDSTNFFSKLNQEDKAFYEKIRDQKIPAVTDNEEITNSVQLDILWAQFYASGSYSTIRRLVDTLKYVEFSGSIENFETSGKTEKDQANTVKEALYKAALWSIRSHYRNYQLVKDYCDYMYKYEKLPGSVKTELGKITSRN